MARTNNLTNFLTDVATSIKAKTGDSTAIPASQFDTKIANITTGHLDNTEYTEANNDLDDILEGTTPMTIYPPDWSELGYEDTPQIVIDDFNYAKDIYDNWDSSITNLKQYFYNNTNIVYMPLVDTSNVTSFAQCFQGCISLKNVPLLNTSNVTNMGQIFQNCSQLESIPLMNTNNVTSIMNMVSSCAKLKNIPVLNTSKITNFSNAFQYCSRLTNESLNNILQMCIGATSYAGTKTLAKLGLTSAQATTCQSLSNYQAFITAGWTTGY